MKAYLYGKYALLSWNIPNILGRIEPEGEYIQAEFVAFRKNPPRLDRNVNAVVHQCLIKGAEKYTTEDGRCLPELAFMQAANSYNDAQLIYLGLQLVSSYDGKAPLCTIEDIYNCAFSLHGHHGRRRVLTIIPYLSEGSRSPMETITYMNLSLPVSRGGRGFRKFQLNYRIDLDNYSRYFIADMCWPEKKIIVEYQGQHHHKPEQRERDLERRRLLESEGYHIIEVWSEDIHKAERFEAIVQEIEKVSKKRVRYRSGKFVENYIHLRDLLFANGRQRTTRQSRLTQISWHELPRLPWMWDIYQLYVKYYRKFLLKFQEKVFPPTLIHNNFFLN